jgi:hypothetical protein
MMEKITVYFKDGGFIEFNNTTTQMISGNSLLITTKSTENVEDEQPLLVTVTDVIDLSTVKNFVKITQTRKLEYNVSNK